MSFFFFFSSRRRHTRLQGDWSSDVCSSDLIARQKSVLPKRRTKLCIEPAERARQPHAHGPRLSADAAPLSGGHDVNLFNQARELQRLGRVMLPGVIREIFLHRASIHRKPTRARPNKHARNRFLAAARSVKPCLGAHCGRLNCAQCSSSKQLLVPEARRVETIPCNFLHSTVGLLPAKTQLRKEH